MTLSRLLRMTTALWRCGIFGPGQPSIQAADVIPGTDERVPRNRLTKPLSDQSLMLEFFEKQTRALVIRAGMPA